MNNACKQNTEYNQAQKQKRFLSQMTVRIIALFDKQLRSKSFKNVFWNELNSQCLTNSYETTSTTTHSIKEEFQRR